MSKVAEILAIGDELVLGKGTDTNSAKIARELFSIGMPVQAIGIVGDAPETLVAAIRATCARADVVIATGGLGPTGDDRTRAAAAAAKGEPLRFDAGSWRKIEAMFDRRGRVPTPSNRLQAELPQSATVLDNQVGTAPGFTMQIGKAQWFALPGVPVEMEWMLKHHVLPELRRGLGQQAFACSELRAAGASEAQIGEIIARYLAPEHRPRVGITAHYGHYTIRIVAEAEEQPRARVEAARVAGEIKQLLGELVLYEGEQAPHELVGQQCLRQNVSLALAESCTAGLLASQLADVPGISKVLRAGYVVYSNEAKVRDLGVPEALLAAHGAVSVEVAAAMAEGACRRTGARLGVAITGVSGPGGGSAEKPVGTHCLALCCDGKLRSWRQNWPDLGRRFLRERAVLEALFAMHKQLDALAPEPHPKG